MVKVDDTVRILNGPYKGQIGYVFATVSNMGQIKKVQDVMVDINGVEEVFTINDVVVKGESNEKDS